MTKPTTVYLTEKQLEELNSLKDYTGVSIAYYIRKGVDFVLKSNRENLEKAKKEQDENK